MNQNVVINQFESLRNWIITQPDAGFTDVGYTGVGYTGAGFTGAGYSGVGYTGAGYTGVGYTGAGLAGGGEVETDPPVWLGSTGQPDGPTQVHFNILNTLNT